MLLCHYCAAGNGEFIHFAMILCAHWLHQLNYLGYRLMNAFYGWASQTKKQDQPFVLWFSEAFLLMKSDKDDSLFGSKANKWKKGKMMYIGGKEWICKTR
jgi:hypothetical protein